MSGSFPTLVDQRYSCYAFRHSTAFCYLPCSFGPQSRILCQGGQEFAAGKIKPALLPVLPFAGPSASLAGRIDTAEDPEKRLN